MTMQAEHCWRLSDADNKTNSDEYGKVSVDLQESIEKIIEEEGYLTRDIKINQITTDGNFLSMIYEVDVKGETGNGYKEDNILIKKKLTDKNMIVTLSINEAYDRENFIYNELFHVYNELQDGVNMPLEDRFKPANCYNVADTNALFLENLTRKGFIPPSRMETMALKYVELSVKQLARFHGLSMVLERRNPDYFNKKLKPLNYAFALNEEWNNFVRHMNRICFRELDLEYKKKQEKCLEMCINDLPKYLLAKTPLVGSCICHGDYKHNNSMMKITDGVVTEVIPIDYQIIFYGCPITDFMCLIFLGTDKQFRKDHLEDTKNLYYDSLDRFLEYFNLDVADVYPRQEFEKQYKEMLSYGLILSSIFLPINLAPEDDVPDIGKEQVASANFNIKVEDRFLDRIQGILSDFIEWGIL